MPLTLAQILSIILTVAAVVAVIFLVQLFIQLRRTAAEAEKTMIEVRALAKSMSELELVVRERVNEMGDTIKVARKAALGLSEASLRVTSKMLPFPGKYLPLLFPVARFVMKSIKKNKEQADVE
jgi:hypothetical protein